MAVGIAQSADRHFPGRSRSRSEHIMTESSQQMNRRVFLGKSAAAVAASAVFPRTALSYENIVGANGRISLAHIGIGNRGGELDEIVSKLKRTHNVEMTVVCDLWKSNREKAV